MDRNGEISCLDYAITFYKVWNSWHNDDGSCKLIVNRNPNVKIGNGIFNHIFMEIRFLDEDLQFKYYKLDSNVVHNGLIMTPAEEFGSLYDPAYDDRSKGEYWAKKYGKGK